MRKVIRITLAVSILAFLFSPNTEKKLAETLTTVQRIVPTNSEKDQEADEQDGILEAQRMEFELTRDVSLGYVPKYRLIEAYEEQKRLMLMARPGDLEQSSALTWTERGPNSDVVGPSNGNGRVTAGQVTSGRLRAIWVDLADPTNETVWVGGVDGGVWKTNDITADPASWTLMTDLTTNIAIADITQSPVNNLHMYFGTGEKSANADAVRGAGVWKSTDGGNNWNLLGSTTTFWNVSKVVCDPSNVNIVYVATMGTNNTGIQRSIDGGSTWTNITPTGLNTAVTEMEMSSTGRLHIVCGYAGGYFSPNPSGYRYTSTPSTVTSGTWTTATVTFTSTTYNVDIATAGNTLYALPSNSSYQTNQVWKSTDGGANWAITLTTPPIGGATPVSSGQAWYNLAIGVDPSNSNNVMVGGLNSYRSIDGGLSWTPNSVWVTGVPGATQYIHADHHIIVWNNNQILDGGDGGIFYSADDGLTWADRNVGLRLKQFYSVAIHPTTTNYFLGGAQDNGSHQLNGAGLTSSVEVTGGDGAFSHIDQDEPQYQFGAYVFCNYRVSTDGGATWSYIDFNNNGQFINPTDYDNVNDRLYGGYSAGNYFRWDDPQTGSSAFSIPIAAFNAASVTHVNVSPYTSNRVFFGTNGARVVRVDNAQSGSPTGTNITGGSMPASPNSVSCVAVGTTDNDLLVTFSNYGLTTNRIWVSTNGGTGWTNITGNFPDIPARWAMFYPGSNTRAFIASELGVWETTLINGGSTVWVRDPNLPAVRVDMLQYRASDRLMAAATHGRGIWTAIIPVILPVTLNSFEGQLVNKEILLNWKTGSEENSKHFELEKSTNGVNFQSISLVTAAGTSVTERQYQYTDHQLSEFNYYRLRMVDLDGRFTYSNTILIKLPNAKQDVIVMTNPFNSYIDLRLIKIPRQPVQIELLSVNGGLIYQREYSAADRIRIDLSAASIRNGVYLLRTTVDGSPFIRKLVRQ